MARTVAIGHQDFETIRKNNFFYIDKTSFIREWWDRGDSVTLITRPGRLGKTLTMSMVEQFFSVGYAGREDLFQGLAIWEDKKYKEMQGTYPVIPLSFSNVKESSFNMFMDEYAGWICVRDDCRFGRTLCSVIESGVRLWAL